jgi:hypothetical protein
MLRPGFLWRGQCRNWALKPRLDRTFLPPAIDPNLPDHERIAHEIKTRSDLENRYAAQLERFRAAAAGRRGVNPRDLKKERDSYDENDEWWALGQHYGLYTPLLDWTDSPFAALYFAFHEDSSSHRATEPLGEHFRYICVGSGAFVPAKRRAASRGA